MNCDVYLFIVNLLVERPSAVCLCAWFVGQLVHKLADQSKTEYYSRIVDSVRNHQRRFAVFFQKQIEAVFLLFSFHSQDTRVITIKLLPARANSNVSAEILSRCNCTNCGPKLLILPYRPVTFTMRI